MLVLRRRSMSAPAPTLPPMHAAGPRPYSRSPSRPASNPFHPSEFWLTALLALLAGIFSTLTIYIILWLPCAFFPQQLYLSISHYLSACTAALSGWYIASHVVEGEIQYRRREQLVRVSAVEVALAFAVCVGSCMLDTLLGRWLFGVALAMTAVIWRGFASVGRGFASIVKGILGFYDAYE